LAGLRKSIVGVNLIEKCSNEPDIAVTFEAEWFPEMLENVVLRQDGGMVVGFEWSGGLTIFVRSERYFTATLLPAVLFHNNMEGVQHFVGLVDNDARSERNSSGEPSEMGAPEYGNFRDVEVITEFHIARYLTFAGLRLEANVGRRPSHGSHSSQVRNEGSSTVRNQRRFVSVSSRGRDAGDRHHPPWQTSRRAHRMRVRGGLVRMPSRTLSAFLASN
jgi:hypothetical protein